MNLAINNLFNYVPDYYYFNSPTTTGANLTLGLSLDIDRFFKKINNNKTTYKAKNKRNEKEK